jgi:predicted amidophosphoribosyltransferase
MNRSSLRMALAGCGDAICHDFIGLSFPQPPKAIAQSPWKADDPNAAVYCRRCGDSVGAGEATSNGCSTCKPGAELAGGIGDGLIRLGSYTDDLRRWILAAKFDRWEEMAFELGLQLGEQIRRAQVVDPNRAAIVPMPMPWLRKVFRGTDHALVIAAGVGKAMQVPVLAMLARRNGQPQVNLSPSDRKRTSWRDLRIRRRIGGWGVAGAELILVDDVRTTGASLKAAVRLLRTLEPAKVVCGVVAVSDSRARRVRGSRSENVS